VDLLIEPAFCTLVKIYIAFGKICASLRGRKYRQTKVRADFVFDSA
jgi:hypothetical protein